MSYPQQFPASLLTQSPQERLAYFDNYTMAHPRLDEAVNLLKLLVNQSGESRVIFIYGPTGVGKTTLRLLIEKWLIESTLPELETDPGCLPVASVEAVIQKSGLFNSKDHIKRCLLALNEPLIDQKIDYGTRGIYRNDKGQVIIVWGFQLHLPLPEAPDLVSNWDYCYERSLGCVGILKNWLRNALADAIAEGSVTVEKKHLERRALGVAQCRNILKKIKEGEYNHAQIEAEVEQLRAELGLSVTPGQDNLSSQLLPSFHSGNNFNRKRPKQVGQPKPKRHPCRS